MTSQDASGRIISSREVHWIPLKKRRCSGAPVGRKEGELGMKTATYPVIEREPRATFLKFSDGSTIVLREDGKCYPSMPYPPSDGWYPGVKKEDLQSFHFFRKEGECRVREIMTGCSQASF